MLTEVNVPCGTQGNCEHLASCRNPEATPQYDITELKQEAMEDIRSKLSVHNILEEIFSTFASL